jgi:deoxyribose-phosphate aldolase
MSENTNPHPIPLTESEVLIRGFLAANPDLDKQLGPVEMMTDRYTNEEWKAQIDETVKCMMREVASGEKKVYQGPRMRNGEEALKELAKTVDHTVLKLDATAPVIDGMCSEARTESFKVRGFILLWCTCVARDGLSDTWIITHDRASSITN